MPAMLREHQAHACWSRTHGQGFVHLCWWRSTFMWLRWRPIPRPAPVVVCTFAAAAHDHEPHLLYISADAMPCSGDRRPLSPDRHG